MLSRRILIDVALAGFVASFAIFAALPGGAHAQAANGPQILLTWKASNSYIPSFYQGKALPGYGSNITAAIEVVAPNGKLVNLSYQPIYWYLDGTSVGGGAGVQEVTFPPFGTAPSILTLTVNLPQYPGGILADKVEIPYVTPLAVIGAPYPNGEFSTNPVSVTAYPFYFNVSSPSDLSYIWGVNGQTGTSAENPETANISLPQGTPSGTNVDVSLAIKNSTLTMASADQTLIYQSQL